MALPQPLHIFRKDLMHLWPETLFVLLLFVAFAACAPSGWSGSQFAGYIVALSWLLKIVMPISWLVLIARAIQDECLVGDRQFWTSRPYDWLNLFAAKILLIFTCIYVPFFLMQVYLLHHARLHPMLVIPALLHNLLLLTVVLIIPLAALSAVTSTFPRVLLSFIGAIVYILILFAIIGYSTFLEMPPPHLDWLLDGIFIVLPAIALVYQYKTRKTLYSRLILAATPLLAALIFLLTPKNGMIAKSYPVLSGTSAPMLSGLSDRFQPKLPPNGKLATFRDHVSISLPVKVDGIGKDIHFVVQGTRTQIAAPGVAYLSPFLNSIRGDQFSSERPVGLVTFLLPVDVFNKVHNTPVDLHLQLVSEQLRAENPSTWHATLLPFSVPGNGICSFPTGDANPDGPPTCRYPLKQPDISFVTAQLAPGSCANPQGAPVPGQANVGSRSGTLDFDPVVTVPLTFQTGDPEPRHIYQLCPGTELSFIEATPLANASLTLDQKHVVLDPFAERYTERTRLATPQPPQESAPEPQ
jgi:hypothetical protein